MAEAVSSLKNRLERKKERKNERNRISCKVLDEEFYRFVRKKTIKCFNVYFSNIRSKPYLG